MPRSAYRAELENVRPSAAYRPPWAGITAPTKTQAAIPDETLALAETRSERLRGPLEYGLVDQVLKGVH